MNPRLPYEGLATAPRDATVIRLVIANSNSLIRHSPCTDARLPAASAHRSCDHSCKVAQDLGQGENKQHERETWEARNDPPPQVSPATPCAPAFSPPPPSMLGGGSICSRNMRARVPIMSPRRCGFSSRGPQEDLVNTWNGLP
jgi:hypothetical protein